MKTAVPRALLRLKTHNNPGDAEPLKVAAPSAERSMRPKPPAEPHPHPDPANDEDASTEDDQSDPEVLAGGEQSQPQPQPNPDPNLNVRKKNTWRLQRLSEALAGSGLRACRASQRGATSHLEGHPKRATGQALAPHILSLLLGAHDVSFGGEKGGR